MRKTALMRKTTLIRKTTLGLLLFIATVNAAAQENLRPDVPVAFVGGRAFMMQSYI